MIFNAEFENMQATATAKSLAAAGTTATTPNTVAPPPSVASAPLTNDAAANCEIEEISKKISEHADAIYRTWKCRGLAPTQLLEMYGAATDSAVVAEPSSTAASADIFGASKKVVADDRTSNEGLQQLVNTFVIKDKQLQRSASNKKTAILTTATSNLMSTPQKSVNIMKQAKPVTQRPSAIMLPEATAATSSSSSSSKAAATLKCSDAVIAKKVAATTTPAAAETLQTIGKISSDSATVTATSVRKSACASNKLQKTQQPKEEAQPKTKISYSNNTSNTINNSGGSSNKVRSKYAKNDTPSAAIDLNLDLGLDLDLKLQLDVNNLTQLQTQNLLKIKELLQQESNSNDNITEKPKKVKTKVSNNNISGSRSHDSLENVTATAGNRGATTKLVATTTAAAVNDNAVAVAAAAAADIVAADKNSNGSKKANAMMAATTMTTTSTTTSATSTTAANAAKLLVNLNANPIKSTKGKTLKNINNASSSNINSSNNSSASSSISKTSKDKTAPLKNTTKTINSSNTTTATTATLSAATSLATSSQQLTAAAASENIMEIARSSMPAPTKVKIARPLTNGQDKNLGRPILTRGSVAERVLMFEKCPDVRHSFLNIKRPDPVDAPPKSLLKVKLHATPPAPQEQNLLQREIRISGKNVYIPRFYFPHGKPQPQIAIERTLRGILSAFDTFPNNQVTKDELPRILKLCGLPFYWRMPVMVFCQQGQSGLVERQRFVEFWKQMNVYCHDNASRFVYIMSRGQRFRSYILPEDLAPLVQDVVDTHPGLAFLKEATEFHSRYVHTVIARIFYSVNRCWSGRISISELKKSDLLEIITLLEEEDDINQIMAFFSYEHFYVIYCKFWELDRDHDLLINQDDLARHSDHALSTRIVERIFSGCVTRSDNKKDAEDEPKMSYTDFVWFLLSEEDKRTPTAIEYWFRCMDVDGDGVLSMYELEYFYEEQQQRMESIGIETLPFEDCLCQMLDMIKPQNSDCVTLGDLKRCKMTHVFFDTFFNLEKYLDHEQRDPFASQRDEYSSDWDRFAAQEYELLITEENE